MWTVRFFEHFACEGLEACFTVVPRVGAEESVGSVQLFNHFKVHSSQNRNGGASSRESGGTEMGYQKRAVEKMTEHHPQTVGGFLHL